MTHQLRFIALFVVYLGHGVRGDPARSFSIGAMLSSPEIESVFLDVVSEVNTNTSSLLKSAQLNAASYVLNSNPFLSALDVCDRVISEGVFAVIVSHPNTSNSPPIAVSFACGFYRIPLIGISARDSVFSDKVLRKQNELR